MSKQKQDTEDTVKLNDYVKVKFKFEGLDKFVVMELNTRIALEDLKFTFSNVLKVDFFARRLEYYVTATGAGDFHLDSRKALASQLIPKKFEQSNSAHKLQMQIKFIEEGA